MPGSFTAVMPSLLILRMIQADRLLTLRGRQLGDAAGDEAHRVLAQHATGRAVGQPVDRAARRVRGVAIDARELQGRRIGRAVVAHCLLEPHGIVRRQRVEVGRQDHAALGQLALVPARALNPFATLALRASLADLLRDLGDRLHGRKAKIEAEVLFGAAGREVAVRVDQTGRDREAFQVEDLRLRPDPGTHGFARPDGRDLAAGNGDGLRHAVARVHGEHLRVQQDGVGKEMISRGRRGQSEMSEPGEGGDGAGNNGKPPPARQQGHVFFSHAAIT